MGIVHFGAVLGFIVVLCSVDNASAVCDWNATAPCLQAIRGGGQRSDRANLSNIIDSFEAGISKRCNMLQTLVTCMAEATKDCRPDEYKDNRFKIMNDKMKPVVDYFCVKNIAKFIASEGCMKKSAIKLGMEQCQGIIDGQAVASCTMFTDTIKCTDVLVYKECEAIHHELGHVLRMYIRNVMNLDSCQISDHDDASHHHDDDHIGHSSGSTVSMRQSLCVAVVFLTSFIAARSA